MNVKLTKTQRILIESSGDIARIMRQILLRENRVSRQREHLWTIGLSEEYKMQYVELIAFGIPAKTKIQPMEIYRLALQKDCPTSTSATTARRPTWLRKPTIKH